MKAGGTSTFEWYEWQIVIYIFMAMKTTMRARVWSKRSGKKDWGEMIARKIDAFNEKIKRH